MTMDIGWMKHKAESEAVTSGQVGKADWNQHRSIATYSMSIISIFVI